MAVDSSRGCGHGVALVVSVLLSCGSILHAHSGPPYPIVSNKIAGAYDISIWTDPDSTDDGSAQGKFWVVLAPASASGGIPEGTTVQMTIQAMDRQAKPIVGMAAPADGLTSRQYVALLMDHEGPFRVHVVVGGPLGRAEVESQADATYDVRPAPFLLVVFAFPFVAVGLLWFKVMRRRRQGGAPGGARTLRPQA